MRTAKNILSAVACAFLMTTFSACGDGDKEVIPDKKTEARDMLTSGTWNLETVVVDGVVKDDYLSGTTLKFSSGSLTVSNGEPFFNSQDSWEFSNDDATAIETGSGLGIDLQQVTASVLVMRFTWSETTLGGGRIESTAGEHVLTFGK